MYLKKSDIKTFLFSTQGSYGGHNHATKLVLNTKKQYYPWDIKRKILENFLVIDISQK